MISLREAAWPGSCIASVVRGAYATTFLSSKPPKEGSSGPPCLWVNPEGQLLVINLPASGANPDVTTINSTSLLHGPQLQISDVP